MMSIQCYLNKSKQIIGLLSAITLFAIHPCKAYNITNKDSNLLSLSVSCPDNPQCIYSKKETLQLDISIKNNTNQDLEIPQEAMTHLTTSFYFKNPHNGNHINISDPSWRSPPVLFKELTLLPAYGSIIISTIYVIPDNKEIQNAPTNHIIFYAKTITAAYTYDSKKLISSYRKNKLRSQQFTLETEQTIMKK